MTTQPHIKCIKPHIIRRYAAYAFDWTLVGLVMELVPVHTIPGGIAMLALVGGLYFSLAEASPYQGTLGKWLVGIRVEDEEGDRLGIMQSAARFLAGALSWLTLNIGHMMAHWRKDGRALHDLVAKTRVCQEKSLTALNEAAVPVLLVLHGATLVFAMFKAVTQAVSMISSGLPPV